MKVTTPWDEPRCPVQAIERDDETNLTHIIMQQPCLRNARGRQNFTQGVRLPARWESPRSEQRHQSMRGTPAAHSKDADAGPAGQLE